MKHKKQITNKRVRHCMNIVILGILKINKATEKVY